MFAAWGRVAYRFRWLLLAASTILLGSSAVLAAQGGTFSSSRSFDQLEAFRAQSLISAQIHPPQSTTANQATFDLVFRSRTMTADQPAFQSAVEAALGPLTSDSRVASIVTPYSAGPETQATALRSRDGHAVLAVVTLEDPYSVARGYFPSLRAEVRSPDLQILATGSVPIQMAFDQTLEADLHRAEIVSLPVSLVLLLIVFGAVVASALPVGVGALAVVGGVAGTFLLARYTDVSQYALNIVTLIGLGVAIDYSLFMVNRFRDELAAGRDREEAIVNTVATAGRAITFSGLTVAIGLSGMLFYRGTFLVSMGAAGAIVVGLAIVYGLTFLPAALAVLGPRVNLVRISLPATAGLAVVIVGLLLGPDSARLWFGLLAAVIFGVDLIRALVSRWVHLPRLPLPTWRRTDGPGFWATAAAWVMRRPVAVLVPTLGLLIVLGIPFLHLRMANGDTTLLPPRLEARQGFDQIQNDFPGHNQNVYELVVHYPRSAPLTPAHIGDLYDLSRRVQAVPGVLDVVSVVSFDPSLSRDDYVRMLTGSGDALPAAAQAVVQSTTGPHLVVLEVESSLPPSSDGARSLLARIRGVGGVPDAELLVGGNTAVDVDIVGYILKTTPEAVAFVLVVTYLVLFLLTGSVVLPIKAVVMNLLSISASFGALVWIFQDGHLSSQLGFTRQSLDPSIPVILFAIVFGLSMDYEVLLVSRIQEEYQRLGDNRAAIALGLERSGRLITGAAGIMVAVFLSFAAAEVVIIKAVGLGLAIAAAIDASIVRILLVPAVMRLLGRANWWAPGPLVRLHRRAGLGTLHASMDAAPATDQ